MLKNISIGQLHRILFLLLSVLQLLVLVVLYFSTESSRDHLYIWIAALIGSILLSHIIINYFLEKLVVRKINIIYKMIGDKKQNKSIRGSSNIDKLPISKINEEVMEWAQKRESEMKSLTELESYRRNYLRNISHELKTPIFSIQGYIHTLLDGGLYDKNINEKYLRRAASNLERLQNIVEDLEMINNLESGMISLNIENFDLKDLISEVMDDLIFLAKDEEMTIDFNPNAEDSFKVAADREKIRQLLLNLVTNGIKYGRKKGKVSIGFYDADDKVLVEIEDNGIGVEEKHLNHLFDRFYRVDDSRSRKHGGSGLGLAIVKHILEAHNQNIRVRSSVGEGTTFAFTLEKA